MNAAEVDKAISDYFDRFGDPMLTWFGMSNEQRNRVGKKCREALDADRMLTADEVRELEPPRPNGLIVG